MYMTHFRNEGGSRGDRDGRLATPLEQFCVTKWVAEFDYYSLRPPLQRSCQLSFVNVGVRIWKGEKD